MCFPTPGLDMATNGLPTTEELTRQTLELIRTQTDANHEGTYDPDDKRYHNPLKHATDGKHNNWASASSGYLPADTVNAILEAPSVPHGIAEVALLARDLFNQDTDGIECTDDELTGIVEELAERFGRGASAERWAARRLEETGATINEPRAGDEDNKIDIRTDDSLHQVKLNDKPRSDWVPQELPQENTDDENKEKNLIWVKPNGDVMTLKPKEERGHRLTERYEKI